MSKVTSKDGVQISYDKQGQGPALIMVDGAMTFRSSGYMPALAKLLENDFTVYTYDRRGRGESTDSKDTLSDPVGREIEDIDALIQAAGGSAYVYGISSGACLVLEAAIKLGDKVKKQALYEAPYRFDEGARKEWQDYRERLTDLLAAGRRGDAVALFMALVGTPAEMVDGMRQSPMWSTLESIAPTLAYDAADIGEDRTVPSARAARVTARTLAMNGSASFPFMYDAAKAITQAVPHAQLRTLKDQRHDVDSNVLAPVLIEFFKS